MKVRLCEGDCGSYLLEPVATNAEIRAMDYKNRAQFTEELSVLVQTDWDYPGVAATFGWQACECGCTDGTVDCEHKTASEMISSARDFLDEHIGAEVEDPGYFGG